MHSPSRSPTASPSDPDAGNYPQEYNKRTTTAPAYTENLTSSGKPAEVLTLADETVQIKDYGQARQITLFEDGAPVLQVLTSDLAAPAAALLSWLRCRWRIENLFKYLEDNYGIHWLCDYRASLEDDAHLIANPERKAARARLREAEAALATAERELATLLTSPELPAAAKNKAIPAAEKKITMAREAVTAAKAALKKIPAKLPASQITPGAQKAILATRRRSLQMVLRLLAAAAEHWLGNRLNDYLRDPDEYRAIVISLIVQGLTLEPLVRRAGIARPDSDARHEQTLARLRLAEAALARLDELAAGDCAADDVIDRARASLQARIGRTRARIDGTEAAEPDGLTDRELRRDLNAAEHAELARLYDDGTISQAARQQLQRSLDLEAARLSEPR